MPVQDWNINTQPAAAGDVYGLAFTNSQRLTFNAEVAMSVYGVAVQRGAAARSIKPGLNGTEILGVTMRENKLESRTRPGDGTVLIPVGQPLAVMMSGPINVLLKTAITGEVVGVNANGEFGAVGGDFKQVTNAKFIDYPASAGDVVPVMLTLTETTVAAAGGE